MDINRNLSPHFTLGELLYSETAARMGAAIVPDADQYANLESLAWNLLEPIRVELGKPIVGVSGLRPPWLNDLVGGAKDSAHLYGCALDCKVVGMTPREFCGWLQTRDYPALDQCICEFDQWTHIAIAKPGTKPRGQFLSATKVRGKTVYEAFA